MGRLPLRGPADESIAYSELERFVVAGAIDKKLQHLIVQDPGSAVDNTLSDRFRLSVAEKAFLKTLRAVDYHDFVKQVVLWISQSADDA